MQSECRTSCWSVSATVAAMSLPVGGAELALSSPWEPTHRSLLMISAGRVANFAKASL